MKITAWLKQDWFRVGFILIIFLAAFLRLYRLGELPPGPYWEEAALGYDAYSIYQTGRDHHGHPWPIVAFESFGDYKPSLYFYSIIPFLPIFGLSLWAIRLPSVLSGLAIVWGVGYLGRLMMDKRRSAKRFQLLLMFLTAISPWAIQFSRGGWEVNLATALILWGVNLFLSGLEQQKKILAWLLGSVTLLVLSTYAYHAARIVAPLLGLGLAVMALNRDKKIIFKPLLIAAAWALLLISPLLISLGQASTQQRFAETSYWQQTSLIEASNLRRERAGDSLISRVLYHRNVFRGREFISHFLDHFRLDFLFISGDGNPRHSSQIVGLFYHLELIFLIVGIYSLFRKRYRYRWLLSSWLIIGLIPAALTKTTPHALRILPTLPVWLILIGLGLEQAWQSIRFKKLFVLTIGLIYLVEFSLYWRFYTRVYPQLYASEWQAGAEDYVRQIQNQLEAEPEETVEIEDRFGRTLMFYWYYQQLDPTRVQAEADQVKMDQGEFLEFERLRLK